MFKIINIYLLSDQNSSETKPFEAAHTYMPDIGNYMYPSSLGQWEQSSLFNFDAGQLGNLALSTCKAY